jgi:hypothetical protein
MVPVFFYSGICCLCIGGVAAAAIVERIQGASNGPEAPVVMLLLLPALLSFWLALWLSGPLAAFSQARTIERVTLWKTLALAIPRLFRLALVILPAILAGATGSILAGVLLGLMGSPPVTQPAPDGDFTALAALVAGLVYLSALGLLGLAEAFVSPHLFVGVLRRAWQLGRGHRTIVLCAVLAATVPLAATVGTFLGGTLQSGSPQTGPAGLIGPLMGCLVSVPWVALLATAAHAVASGDLAELADPP